MHEWRFAHCHASRRDSRQAVCAPSIAVGRGIAKESICNPQQLFTIGLDGHVTTRLMISINCARIPCAQTTEKVAEVWITRLDLHLLTHPAGQSRCRLRCFVIAAAFFAAAFFAAAIAVVVIAFVIAAACSSK